MRQIPQFLDMAEVHMTKVKTKWPTLCYSALTKAELTEQIKVLAALRGDIREQALQLDDWIVNAHLTAIVPFNKPTTKAHEIIWMPEGVHNGLVKNVWNCGVADYMFLQIYVVKCILEDDTDFVSEFLGNSLSELLEFIISWDDWLDDQIQIQYETLENRRERQFLPNASGNRKTNLDKGSTPRTNLETPG